MIEAAQFVEAARERGFDWYAGVPCSYLTPFINYVLQDPALHYVSMANEGDAVALIAGVALAGDAVRPYKRGITMMQNSGLGNAVSPLTSLTWTFRLPQLLIVTWRGQPDVPDEPQHALMGPITPRMLDLMEIAWELFPTETEAIGPSLARAVAHMDVTGKPYCLLMQKPGAAAVTKGYPSSSAVIDGKSTRTETRPSRTAALREVVSHTPEGHTVVLASTGFCGRELYAVADRPNQLYMVGSMGCVVPLGLGLALARPDLTVVALDGDGAALIRTAESPASPDRQWRARFHRGPGDRIAGDFVRRHRRRLGLCRVARNRRCDAHRVVARGQAAARRALRAAADASGQSRRSAASVDEPRGGEVAVDEPLSQQG
jgi:phosphonopyruvate decarboxylase